MSAAARNNLDQTPPALVRIGTCSRCFYTARLEDGLCPACLAPTADHERRLLAIRVLLQYCPDFSRAVYQRLRTIEQQRAFVRAFGLPPDAQEPGLRLARGGERSIAPAFDEEIESK